MVSSNSLDGGGSLLRGSISSFFTGLVATFCFFSAGLSGGLSGAFLFRSASSSDESKDKSFIAKEWI
jgi:hypothetical protein